MRVKQCVRPSNYPLSTQLSVHQFICLSILYLLIRTSFLPSKHLSIHSLSIHSSTYLFNNLSICHLSTHPSIFSSVHPPVYPFFQSIFHPIIHLSAHCPSTYLPICSSVHLPIQPSVCPPVYPLTIHLAVYSFVYHLSTHPPITLPIYPPIDITICLFFVIYQPSTHPCIAYPFIHLYAHLSVCLSAMYPPSHPFLCPYIVFPPSSGLTAELASRCLLPCSLWSPGIRQFAVTIPGGAFVFK